MSLAEKNSKAAAELAAKKKESLARANRMRAERDAASTADPKSQMMRPSNMSDALSVRSYADAKGSAMAEHIVIRRPTGAQSSSSGGASSLSTGKSNYRSRSPLMESYSMIEDPSIPPAPASVAPPSVFSCMNNVFQCSVPKCVGNNFCVGLGRVGSSPYLSPPRNTEGYQFDLCDRPLQCMSINESTNEAVIGSTDHSVYSIDIKNPKKRTKQMYSKKYGHTEWVTGVAHLVDGRVLSCGMDSKLCLWALDRVRCTELPKGHFGSITKVVTDHRFNVAMSTGYDGKVNMWSFGGVNSTPSGPSLTLSGGHKGPILEAAYVESTLVTGGREGSVCLWDLSTGTMLKKMKAHHPGSVSSMCVMNGSGVVITGGSDSKVRIWDARAEKPCVSTIDDVHKDSKTGALGAVGCMTTLGVPGASNSGELDNYIITGGADNAVVCLDWRGGAADASVVNRWEHHSNCVYTVCPTGGNRGAIFSGDGAGMLMCYDVLKNGKDALKYGLGACERGAIQSISCLGDAEVVCACEDGNVMVYSY